MMSATAMQPAQRVPSVDRQRRMAELIGTASIEISPRDDPEQERLSVLLPPGTMVFVNNPGSATHHDIVAACVELRRAGFSPVPHVAARRLASFTQARDFLERAAREAGVKSILPTAGDPAAPVGPFRDSLDLLATGLLETHGIHHIAFAGYPEGHPRIDRNSLDTALRDKIAFAGRLGLAVSIVTQFGFDAGPIRRWILSLREEGFRGPIQVGIAGPATIATLAKFAVRCGVGASLRALGRGQTAFARILTETTPDVLIAALVADEERGPVIDGLHVFTFGGVRQTAAWLRVRGCPAPAPLS
jgi:methylenetetrahydrofolate reductase (NADPH)